MIVVESKTDTEMATIEMGAGMKVVIIEMAGEEVVGFTVGEVAIVIIAEPLYCAIIDTTNSGI